MKKLMLILIVLFSLNATHSFAATPTLADKIDQMIIVGFNGTAIGDKSDIKYILSNSNVGGIILFDYNSKTKRYGKNIVSFPQLRTLTSQAQSFAKTPLLIAIDEEGGTVSRLKKIKGYTTLPSARTLGTTSLTNVTNQNKRLAKTLSGLGINTNFAPVLDLTSTNKNSPLTKQARTFSANPNTVASYGKAVVNGLNTSNIVSAGKHFPGLGDALIDTHTGSATITTHNDKHLIPYQTLSSVLPMVMVSHVIDTKVDTLPASISKKHIDVLRKNIGYKGVIVTDDIDMAAIADTYNSADAALLSIKAGADMVIVSNNIKKYDKDAVFEIRNKIMKAVSEKEISEKQITESYNRIIALKKTYSIIK